MKNIHNQNVAELTHYIIVFYTQGQVHALAIHEFQSSNFLRNFETISSPLNLESSQQTRYSTVSCCLMAWSAKDTLISFKPLVFEQGMGVFFSSPLKLELMKVASMPIHQKIDCLNSQTYCVLLYIQIHCIIILYI